ncbi:hypothetical protein J5X98_21420 [Leptothermofonsia sichuanensis E412]|nr:hypothetical protein [Leptothermofonsia sichuanensis]QZZ19845.1 hypothetical protein J5X98_21420 [Leptothermofonsia sichuanensis E412]
MAGTLNAEKSAIAHCLVLLPPVLRRAAAEGGLAVGLWASRWCRAA